MRLSSIAAFAAAAILVFIVSSGSARGQSVTAPLAFEVASIRQSPPPDGQGMRVGCRNNPGRITCTNMTLTNLVAIAYGLSSYQISDRGMPELGRFEIAVKIPEGASKEQIKLMWQNLLSERFKLAVQFEKIESPVYELRVAKGGLKLKEPVPAPSPNEKAPAPQTNTPPVQKVALGKDGFPELAQGVSMAIMGNRARWRATNAGVDQIVSMLSSQLRQPVKDATGLTGKYDLTLSWVTVSLTVSPAAAAANRADGGSKMLETIDADGPTLVQAVQEQLGLTLEQKKGSVEILVVDHAEKPSEN